MIAMHCIVSSLLVWQAWNVATAPTNTNLYGKKDYKLSLPRRIKRSDCPPKYTNLCDTWNVATTSKNTNLHDTKDYKFGPPRTDKRCGSAFQADCIEGVCCSSHGWCGSTKAHCDCIGCYRFTEDVSSGQSQETISSKNYKFGPPRTDKRCGRAFQADCIEGVCCSSHGWCGSTKAHCDCNGCYRFTEDVSSDQSQGKVLVLLRWRDVVKVVDIMNSKECEPIAQYPGGVVSSSAGTLLEGKPTVCGGLNHDIRQVEPNCYQYDHTTDSWKHLAVLSTARYIHAIVEVKGRGLWVTGGITFGDSLKSTEFIHADGTVEQGPDLPSSRIGHCMVDLQNGKYMIIGGLGGQPKSEVLIYDPASNSFVRAPDLLIGNVVCTLFRSPMHNLRPVVLVNWGSGEKNSKSRSFILDYTSPSSSWLEIGSLPFDGWDMYNCRAVSNGNNVYLLNANHDTFYHLSCSKTSCSWTKMKRELSTDRTSIETMMLLPENYSC